MASSFRREACGNNRSRVSTAFDDRHTSAAGSGQRASDQRLQTAQRGRRIQREKGIADEREARCKRSWHAGDRKRRGAYAVANHLEML